jgi:hypothetical protein
MKNRLYIAGVNNYPVDSREWQTMKDHKECSNKQGIADINNMCQLFETSIDYYQEGIDQLIVDGKCSYMPEDKRVKALGEFLKEQEAWQLEYSSNNDDFIDGYDLYLFETVDLDKAKAGLNITNLTDHELKEIIENNHEISRENYMLPENALSFASIDEMEVQITGIYDDDFDCVFTGLTEGLKPIEVNAIAHIYLDQSCLKDDCLYVRPNFSSIQLRVDFEVLQEKVYEKEDEKAVA